MACALALIALGVLVLVGIDLPLLNTLSAILLILSGLFLIGTIVYARRKAGATEQQRAAA
jgi:hypothetical protein